MKSIACRIASLLIVGCFALAQGQAGAAGADEAALKAIEAKWDAASVKGDAAALDTIFADTFISTSTEGKVRTKAEMLAQIKSGAVKYQSSQVDDVKVALYGDAAVVSGQWRGKYTENGKNVEATERFTDTFVRQNGKWLCVASHGSLIK